ncbi:MAG: endolytic transglycosylase MltG [Pseudorhodoplanes sp.]
MAPRSPRAALEPERVNAPRRSRGARHPLVIAGNAIFTIVLLLAVVIGAGVFWGKKKFEEPGPLQEDKVVNIPRGLGVRDIAELLAREGVISDTWVFVGGAAVLKMRGDELKFGEYQFNKAASLRDVAQTMIDSKVVQHQVTVAEGLTSEQIVARLLENQLLTGALKEVPREGTLLPESYRFTRGTSREEIVKRMQAAQRKILLEVWERRVPDLPVKTPEQLLTLASIIEKETGKPEERTRVAAVFVNRLKQKMKLQSDPTIVYGLVGGKGALGRGILRSEISQPTPYNTYVIEGLPPGPIANPGRASIEAAANPARTKELFFVADGTGGHTFSESYDAHQKGVAKLRGLEKDAADAAAGAQPQTAVPAAAAPDPAAKPAAPSARPANPAAASAPRAANPAAAQQQAPRPAQPKQPPAAARSQNAPAPAAPRTQ